MVVYLVPTVHISSASVTRVQTAIRELKPAIVAVELCPARYAALVRREKPSVFGLLSKPRFALLYLAQQSLGALAGVSPGAEMRAAVETAAQARIPVLLADRDISLTLSRLSRVPLREQVSAVIPFVLSGGRLPGGVSVGTEASSRGAPTNFSQFEDFADPARLAPLLAAIAQRFPVIYSVLISERDDVLFSRALPFAVERDVVVVVGAGHVPGVLARFAEYNKNHALPIDVRVVR